MSLLAINKKATPTTIAGTSVILKQASSDGAHGPEDNVSAELRNLTEAQYLAIMTQARNNELTLRWSNGGEEFQTGPLLVGFENHDYYIDLAGNDLNPGTLAQPFATLDAAHNAISALGTHRGRLRIHLGVGVFPVDSGREYELSRPSGPFATPLFYIGTPTDELGTIMASIDDTDAMLLTVASAVPGAADDYFGATLICTNPSSPNFGQRRLITANTAGAGPNTFRVNEQFYFDSIRAGDTFLVQRPGSTIQATGFLVPSQYNLFGAKYINFDGAFGFFGCAPFTSSCSFVNTFVLSAFQNQWFMAGSSNPWDAESDNPIDQFGISAPAGVFMDGAFVICGTSSTIGDGNLLQRNGSILRIEDGASANFSSCHQKGSSVIVEASQASHFGPFNLDYTNFLPLVTPGEAVCDGDNGQAGIGSWYYGPRSYGRYFNAVRLDNATEHAINLNNAANLNLGQPPYGSPGFVFRPWVVGATAAGAGVAAKQVSQVSPKLVSQATGAAASTTATGFNGLVGAGAVAGLNVGDLLEVSGAALAGTNRVYLITAVNSPTDVNTSPAPVSPDANDGAISWTLWNCPHLTGASGDILLGGRFNTAGAQVGGLSTTYAEAATLDASGNRGMIDTALNQASAIEYDPNNGI